MRLRMADEDQQRYGGPEWLDFGDVPAWLDGLGYDDLVAVEDQITAELGKDSPLLWVMYQLVSDRRAGLSMRMRRVVLWLSLRAAGVDVALAGFQPSRMWAVRAGQPASDAVPPAIASDSSPTSSRQSDATTTSSTSESSTGASTPGLGAPTA